LDSRPFGPKITRWIPAFAGMTVSSQSMSRRYFWIPVRAGTAEMYKRPIQKRAGGGHGGYSCLPLHATEPVKDFNPELVLR
jgi:hypothetical protein